MPRRHIRSTSEVHSPNSFHRSTTTFYGHDIRFGDDVERRQCRERMVGGLFKWRYPADKRLVLRASSSRWSQNLSGATVVVGIAVAA